jgi:hypothetical protein
MTRLSSFMAVGGALVIGLSATTSAQQTVSPLKLVSSRVSLAGTSNIHAYTATTTAARLVRLQVGNGVLGPHVWEAIVKPGALEAFEISIPAATLSSPKDGLDKNMHKALKVTEHPDIVFRLARIEGDAPGALRGVGVLKIAGVERAVTIALKTQTTDSTLTVTGDVSLLMTDFGIAPPKAMLGMLKTDPKVTITFETVFGISTT